MSGARWLRCDLHVHTPFDLDKKFGENTKHAIEAFKKEKAKKLDDIAARFIEACRKGASGNGLDLVALTDHNSIDGYRHLFPHIQGANRSSSAAEEPLAILPGVELSAGGERPIHFLILFTVNTDPDDIERAIAHVFGENERFDPKTGTPRSTGQSLDSFLKKLQEYCAPSSGDRRISYLVIPAHADSDRGLMKETGGKQDELLPGIWGEMKGHLREWAVTRQSWDGFQTLRGYREIPEAFRDLLCRWLAARRGLVWDELGKEERRRIRELDHWALIEASDPCNYEELGNRFTWMKMEAADLEGIRLSLLDPDSRLRRMSDAPTAPSYSYIRSISIRKTDFFETVDLPFSAHLNTVIGGRGSGKSTVVECLRYTLDRARTEDFADDEAEIRTRMDDFVRTKRRRDFGDTAGMLLENFKISVEVEVAGRAYQVNRSKAGLQIGPSDAAELPESLDARALIAPRILSQGQIARIAHDPAAQRRELDALMDSDLRQSLSEQLQRALDEMAALQVQRQTLREEIARLPARRTELRKVKDQVTFLETEENRNVLQTYEQFREEKDWIDDMVRTLEDVREELQQTKSLVSTRFDDVEPVPDGPSKRWIRDILDGIKDAVPGVVGSIDDAQNRIHELIGDVRVGVETDWKPRFETSELAYRTLEDQMRDRGVDFAQHERLVEKRASLTKQVRELQRSKTKLSAVESALKESRERLVSIRAERLEARRRLASSLEEQDADVRLELQGYGERRELLDLRETWFPRAGLQERDWEILVEYVSREPDSLPDRMGQLVESLRADVETATSAGRAPASEKSVVCRLIGKTAAGRLTGHFFNVLEQGDRVRLDAMERFLPEDLVHARVRGGTGEWKPIDQGSMGLKNTAVLSLLLSGGTEPLIIDQPEQDLDNRYVYDVVVDLLRKRKFSRQLILATHDPNVPVNGDAELILALEVEGRLGKLLVAGSIDRQDVKEAVTAIMEGSDEAFRLRRDRYGY